MFHRKLLALCVPGLFFAACSAGGGGGDPDAGRTDSEIDAAPTLHVAWDWNGVIGTGQSLSVGGLGTPVLATTQRFSNLKLSLGDAVVPPFDPGLPSLAMVPLTEPIRPDVGGYPSAYPGNIDGETPHTAMADQITQLVMDAAGGHDYVGVHSVVGESGQPMTVIKKNGVFTGGGTGARAYAATLFEVAAIARLAREQGKTYGVGAVTIIHGESDAGNINYASDLFQLISDYNADLLPLTGQTQRIQLLVSQQNSVPSTLNQVAVSAVQQWKAGVDHPGDVVCVGPKYQYSYARDATDHVHMGAAEYEKVGEKMGQVYFERVVLGHDWQPLQPTSSEISGNVITLHFHVPVPPLVFDDTVPPPHTAIAEWANGRGFEVSAAGPAQTIDAVEIVGGDTVKITCRSDLTGRAVTVGYAATSDGRFRPDGGTWRWGQLKDSDPFVGSMTHTPQPNWAVTFQMSLP